MGVGGWNQPRWRNPQREWDAAGASYQKDEYLNAELQNLDLARGMGFCWRTEAAARNNSSLTSIVARQASSPTGNSVDSDEDELYDSGDVMMNGLTCFTEKPRELTWCRKRVRSKLKTNLKRIVSSSPAPDLSIRSQPATSNTSAIISPVPFISGTPITSNLPMGSPPVSHSQRSSYRSFPPIRRSVFPAPSLPLPAVKPLEVPLEEVEQEREIDF